tara:strand:- start:383 stop:946 length:564 start_codon:yes stop_codon:yes gene_type:complete
MFDSIFSDGSLREYIDDNLKDPWEGTNFEGYVFMSPKQKGEFGERFVHKYMELLEYKVERAKTSTAGHDRVILEYLEEVMTSSYLTEIKFSLATRDKKGGVIDDKFIINHVSVGKDWERLIFCGINPDEKDVRFVFITKEDFEAHLKSDDCYFNVQQGGKKVGNDDYICTNVAALLECDFVKDISEW